MQAGLYRVESQEEKETGEWVEGQEQSGEMHVHTHNWLWASLSLSLCAGVDVAFATQMIKVALKGEVDTIVLWCGDGDFVEAMRLCRDDCHKDLALVVNNEPSLSPIIKPLVSPSVAQALLSLSLSLLGRGGRVGKKGTEAAARLVCVPPCCLTLLYCVLLLFVVVSDLGKIFGTMTTRARRFESWQVCVSVCLCVCVCECVSVCVSLLLLVLALSLSLLHG